MNARQQPAAASARFQVLCKQNGIARKSKSVSAAWNAFKQFCEVPLERNLEGAQFEFKQAKFELPDGPFYLSFTRYWYEPGEESDTSHVAQFALKYAYESSLVPLSFEIETNSNAQEPSDDLATLREFIQQIDAKVDLWNALQVRKPTSLDFYAGPQ